MQVLKEDIRGRILAVAKLQFGQKGYSKTSIREIAELAGIGVGYLFTKGVAVGLGLLGGGLLVLALGILAVWLVVWCFGWFVPWAVKGIVKLCKKPFEKRKEREA